MLGKFTELTSKPDHVTIDIETYDPELKSKGSSWVRKEGHILGIAVKIDDLPSEYYPLRHETGNNYDIFKVKEYVNNISYDCESGDIPWVLHYGYYDLGWLDYEHFIDITKCPMIRDTLIMSQLFHSQLPSYSLDFMTQYFGCGKKSDMDFNLILKLPPEAVDKYASNDTDITDSLYRVLKEKPLDHLAVSRENDIIPIIVMMKKQGIKIDMERLTELEKEFTRAYVEYISRVHEVDQKVDVWKGGSIEMLFKRLGLTYPRTVLGNPSFTQGFLETVNHPIIQALSRARKINKLLSTFITGIKMAQYNGVIHPDYYNGKSEYGGTITGRFSSANPNIQQIPSRTEEGMMIRELMIADGAWARFDYSQQEPRLILHYASKLALEGIDYWKLRYEENPDTDFYDVLMTITEIQDRFIMKTNTLATMYGMGDEHMGDMLNVPVGVAKQYRAKFYEAIPWIVQLRNFVQTRVREYGQIKTLGNRTLRFEKRDDNKCFNHLIQGSAADQTKQAMINVYNNTSKIPLSQIHDELNYDLSEENLQNGVDEIIVSCMRNAFTLDFPTKIDSSLGINWKEACGK